MSEKLKKILKENARFEKQSPYNFCDRWCERCPAETTNHCRLFHDEYERRVMNIAHGRAEDDLAAFEEQFKEKLARLEAALQPWEKKFDRPELEEIEEEIDRDAEEEFHKQREAKREKVSGHPLYKMTHQYMKKTYGFLKEIYYDENEKIPPDLKYHYETVSWYHTLMSAKIYRAISSFYEPKIDEKEDFELSDAVAQLIICQKGIKQSQEAWKKIAPSLPDQPKIINDLLAVLHNMNTNIELIIRQI
ncbi:MAG: hypothetical protein AAB019_06565 [Planctomycetota bacterium]